MWANLAHYITLHARMRARTISCPAISEAGLFHVPRAVQNAKKTPMNLSARMPALNFENTEQTQARSNFESIVHAYRKTLPARMRAHANQYHRDLREPLRSA
jgi:hypothetical protein